MGFSVKPNDSVSNGSTLIIFTYECNLMTPHLLPWHAADREAAKRKKVHVFVQTAAMGKWSDALISAELQPCADWPVAGC